jgi:hypothetical protein
MSDINLRYLEKLWLRMPQIVSALKNYSNWSDEKLFRILRHHEIGDGISDSESWLRDEFDFLLSFYGIIELATMIGFVGEIPTAFKKRHLPILCHRAVRQYYEWSYPLALPRRLRERLQSGVSYTVQGSPELNTAFYEFIDLTKLIELDSEIESFLWCLDGGARKMGNIWCDIDLVRVSLAKPKRLAKALQQPKAKQDELDRALCGFCKFVQFCENFASLLDQLEAEPQVAEAMWLAHAYWLRNADADLRSNLRSAILALVEWDVPHQDTDTLRTRATELLAMFDRLAVPPLTNWKVGLPGSGRRGRSLLLGTIASEGENVDAAEVRAEDYLRTYDTILEAE